jgi:hypothetical protein
MRRIFTRTRPGLDPFASLWAVRKFVSGAAQAAVVFRDPTWNGSGMEPDELAIDLRAGGRGMQVTVDREGIVHSCFATIVERYAPPEDRAALADIAAYIDAQRVRGSAVNSLAPHASREARAALGATGLQAIVRGLRMLSPDSDLEVLARLSQILDGLLEFGRARQRALEEADRAEMIGDGSVAIVTDALEPTTNAVLMKERGVRVIVYVNGPNMGLLRAEKESLRMDHRSIRAVVREAGEEAQWFSHPMGFLYARGTRKQPVDTPSRVDPRELAEVIAALLG